MKSENRLKYIFFASAAFLLVSFVFISRYAAISCDEILHYDHSETVFDFFATGGADRSALDTPETQLKYYGQAYDNLVTLLIHCCGIRDVYGFRHLMSAIAGWIVILLTALFAVWLSGWRAGIIVMFLFAVSPVFIGHSLNNLKDIPFALGYVASVFLGVRFVFTEDRRTFKEAVLLTLSIAFALSIRAGGLLLICYLFFFWVVRLLHTALFYKDPRLKEYMKLLLILVFVSMTAYFLSILFWPYALQDPLRNVIKAYHVMADFPSTFRQLFEGRMIWSDQMPWYFIPKSMAITIPLVVTAGVILFLVFLRSLLKGQKSVIYAMIVFSVVFPLAFVAAAKPNVYSSWRQFLFLYPMIVLLSASGIISIYERMRQKVLKVSIIVVVLLLSFHPLKFMAENLTYSYLYYNQLAGGLRGAYGSYETDYYYTAQGEASEWLIGHLSSRGINSAVVAATFPVDWYFRDNPGIRTFYVRNEERSMYEWDYAIITNRYIPAFRLKSGKWPPGNAIKVIYADSVPLCAVLERINKAGWYGYEALEQGRNADAVRYFEEAVNFEGDDEMIFYNFARALCNEGLVSKADSALKKATEINPVFETAFMYLGNIALHQGKTEIAADYYRKVIEINNKYYKAYTALAGIEAQNDIIKAREILRSCLNINPHYKEAVTALADTYRNSDPSIAEKYDRLAETLDY